jgi:lysophospholipase
LAEAPLLATPLAPVPAGAAAYWFAGAGAARLRAALFPPAGASRGSVIVSPGRTEPIEKYFEVASRLTALGFVVLIHDWRGHGLSARLGPDRRGHAHGWRDFIADFAALLASFETRLPRPWIALGHSMGGCLTLLALAMGERRFAGALLSAPMLGVQTGSIPRPIVRGLAASLPRIGLGGALAVRETATEPFAANILTHDPGRYARNLDQVVQHPDLAVGPPTWGWLDFAFSATDRVARGQETPRITTPVSIIAAGEERLVDNAAARRVAARIPGARFAVAPGAYHELMQETDALQAPFWAAFAAVVAETR